MSTGFGARINQDTRQKEFSTVNKDGKTVWEPGLPATVTARRQHRPQKGAPVLEEVSHVSCDLRLTLKLPASGKVEWLERAVRAMGFGKTKIQDVFNIISHPKFASCVSEKYGKRMLQVVAENMDRFSEKQRLTLSRCKLAELFNGDGEVPERDPSPSPPRRPRRSRSRSRISRTQKRSPSRAASSQGCVSESPVAKTEEDLEWEETRKKQEEEKRQIEAQKQALKDQEAKRKAKLGAAFQFEPEEDLESTKKQLASKLVSRKEELPSLALSRASAQSEGDPRFVEAMGGDKLLQEAHKILRNAAGSGRVAALSRSRSRRRGGREGRPHVRSSGSYRSPTPDGRARGQARAARKAKMIASLMGAKK
ncbi:unnamed protein product [Effrenium voratum]|nr:unnamed protein product [Effrenium voratum]